MKIIQFLGELDEHGVGRYIIELNAALKMAGYDVEIVYLKNSYDNSKKFVQVIPNVVTMEYGEEIINKLNSADIVLINTNVNAKAEDQYRINFYDVISKVTNPIKAAFCNDHNSPHYKTYVNDFTGGDDHLDFVRNIDKFVTFSPLNAVLKKIEKSYPDIMKKYVHLQHPYRFSETPNFAPFDKKYRRATYMGRFCQIKDPMRMLRQQQDFIDNNYQLEMRGMVRTFTLAFTPNMVYQFHEDGTRTTSPFTLDLTTPKSIMNKYPGEPIDLIHMNDRDINKIYLFGRYKREEGMEAMKYSQYGIDFIYHKKNPIAIGDNVEYIVAEIVDVGTIPLLDYDTMANCRIYDENGELTGKMAIDYPCGICFKKDGSNIDDVMKQMNELSANKNLYDKYRNDCLAFYKKMFDPVNVANKLVKDIINPDNSKALADFGL